MKRNGKERNIWMQQLLNLPPRLVPFNTLIIGYPKEMIKPKDKWKEENVTRIYPPFKYAPLMKKEG